jgi:hypothetical protein
VVATGDKAAGTDVIRSMAERVGATATEVEASHVVMVSLPKAVADMISESPRSASGQLTTTIGGGDARED